MGRSGFQGHRSYAAPPTVYRSSRPGAAARRACRQSRPGDFRRSLRRLAHRHTSRAASFFANEHRTTSLPRRSTDRKPRAEIPRHHVLFRKRRRRRTHRNRPRALPGGQPAHHRDQSTMRGPPREPKAPRQSTDNRPTPKGYAGCSPLRRGSCRGAGTPAANGAGPAGDRPPTVRSVAGPGRRSALSRQPRATTQCHPLPCDTHRAPVPRGTPLRGAAGHGPAGPPSVRREPPSWPDLLAGRDHYAAICSTLAAVALVLWRGWRLSLLCLLASACGGRFSVHGGVRLRRAGGNAVRFAARSFRR
jgi:hypothetical protein